jgi:hypothetical protein
MMIWRSLKAGTILAALRPAKKKDQPKPQTAKSAPGPQPNPAH